ncbi:uncharacterized protein LOC106176837 [Lingula anatina]|uniref:Uncharacterized protein LOC106176837 n=1 Tax=Lingula anatina TaxID=7574 RepID=A0A1S3JXQ5_LINAN|nr:uncharacterized protein LOC106176837 [Lingula anatina]|eukprot:XP_013414836.1 uncharacterized protein LOC106176837 [Lingula anatina]
MNNKYPPLEYSGPYPINQLLRAREKLIFHMERNCSSKFQKIKNKLGFGVPYYEKYRNKDPTIHWNLSREESNTMDSKPGSNTNSEKKPGKMETTLSEPMKGKRKHIDDSNHDRSDAEPSTKRHKTDTHVPLQRTISNKLRDGNETRVVNGPVTGSTSINSTENGQIFFCFKCDFCPFSTRHYRQAEAHLKENAHFSASLYKARSLSQSECQEEPVLMFVVKKMAVTNQSARCQTLVAVCPECSSIFEDIFTCSIHYQERHQREVEANNAPQGCYAICRILNVQTLGLKHLQCTKCDNDKIFKNRKKLRQHWKQKGHHPFPPSEKPVLRLFLCPYCNRSTQVFDSCYKHIRVCQFGLRSNSSAHVENDYQEMIVKHILHPENTKTLKLLPSLHEQELKEKPNVCFNSKDLKGGHTTKNCQKVVDTKHCTKKRKKSRYRKRTFNAM